MFEKETKDLREDVKKVSRIKVAKNTLTVGQAHEKLKAAKEKD